MYNQHKCVATGCGHWLCPTVADAGGAALESQFRTSKVLPDTLPLMCICVLQVYREASTLYARYDRSSRWSEWPSLRADLVSGGLRRKQSSCVGLCIFWTDDFLLSLSFWSLPRTLLV
jgi:hypothetical protein